MTALICPTEHRLSCVLPNACTRGVHVHQKVHAKVGPAAEGAAAAAAAEAEAEDDGEGGDGERWMSGAELEGFKGDWMALARKRTGRTASGVSAAAAAGGGKGGRRGAGSARDTSPVAHRPTLALQSNVRKQKRDTGLITVARWSATTPSPSQSREEFYGSVTGVGGCRASRLVSWSSLPAAVVASSARSAHSS